MSDTVFLLALAAMVGTLALAGGCNEAEVRSGTTAEAGEAAAGEADGILTGLTINDLHGEPVELADRYAGRAVLIVNTASHCGRTPQYAGLQELHERYAEQGLAVVGVPSGDFGGQEFDTADEIASFCEANYGVTFDLMEKSHVRGDERIELFARLTDPANDPTAGGDPQWNFEKFIIDRRGRLIARYRSGTEPTAEEMIEAIEQALSAG